MPETLYQRLGGARRIAAIVEDSIDRHAVNPVLAPRFRGKDLPRLTQLGTQFFCAGVGGPHLRAVRAGMNLSEQELVAAIDDIVAAMNAHGVGANEVDEVVGILYSLKDDAVLALDAGAMAAS